MVWPADLATTSPVQQQAEAFLNATNARALASQLLTLAGKSDVLTEHDHQVVGDTCLPGHGQTRPPGQQLPTGRWERCTRSTSPQLRRPAGWGSAPIRCGPCCTPANLSGYPLTTAISGQVHAWKIAASSIDAYIARQRRKVPA